jgi:hypothetical protein
MLDGGKRSLLATRAQGGRGDAIRVVSMYKRSTEMADHDRRSMSCRRNARQHRNSSRYASGLSFTVKLTPVEGMGNLTRRR